MKLVVFFRSSKPPYNFWWSGVADGHCAIRLSGPTHHRDTLGKEQFLVFCACVRWASCGRNAVAPKPPGRACQEGVMHPSPVCVSALFWWWWSFPGNGCWLMVALLVLRIWLADLPAIVVLNQTVDSELIFSYCLLRSNYWYWSHQL